ncbi:Protein phosphatase [Actinidia chinensis var. chinensis]|uniref:Protein phosphatase n=1 Tax=Actinidia chinensis var. chinensis TaxID=1590841 RepID=A0A2R6R7L8_ACTCC|nr:Protein phosphatase [Actinidia chinensis var. chinensis]
MDRKQNISQYRGRLDKTLASHDLANEETLKNLVKNQMLRSSECGIEEYIDNVVEKRTKEISNILQMLKSASLSNDDGSKTKETGHRGWKLKQDTEECRVMYREGPEGTPLHTLLVEGYVDGPVDVCLCISWESSLYKKWWPQFTIPTFKILSSERLKKVRIGEQISIVRMKVSWPLSAREAVVHFFEFEYFQDDLIIVLMNSLSELESIDRSTHGFTKDGIPDAQDMVRIDVVGGFVIQKVNEGRSYFRTIANMDIKLDFVPPSLINFISRQLIGSGFKLYQKEVASVSKGDEDFGKALRDPVYDRIRKALYSDNRQLRSVPENCQIESCVVLEEHVTKPMQAKERITDGPMQSEDIITDGKVFSDIRATKSFPEDTVATDSKDCGEIEEIEEEEIGTNGNLEQDHEEMYNTTAKKETEEKCCVNYKNQIAISSEVKRALETLEKAISFIREYGVTSKAMFLQGLGNEQSADLGAVKDSESSEDSQVCSGSAVVCDEVSKDKAVDRPLNKPRNSSSSLCSRHTGSNSYSREANLDKIVPASPEEDIPNQSETHQTAFSLSNNEATEEPISARSTNGNKLVNADANGIHKNSPNKGKNKRMRFRCLHFISG